MQISYLIERVFALGFIIILHKTILSKHASTSIGKREICSIQRLFVSFNLNEELLNYKDSKIIEQIMDYKKMKNGSKV